MRIFLKKRGYEERETLFKSRKSQITVFIIIALVFLLLVIVFFLKKDYFSELIFPKSPFERFKECLESPFNEGMELVMTQGGAIEPVNYHLYKDRKIDYLCFTTEYYKGCAMQKPLLDSDIKEELERFIKLHFFECAKEQREKLESEGYSVSFNKQAKVKVDIIPKKVIVSVMGLDLKISRDKSSESYKNIKAFKDSRLYDFIILAMDIANKEADTGEVEIMSYMVNYLWLKMEKIRRDDGTKIYILTNRQNNEKFAFAIKSFVVPPGLIG